MSELDGYLEAIPNVSEGRSDEVIGALEKAAGPLLLDRHSDPHHNRTVLTLASRSARNLVDTLIEIYRVAVDLIDLSRHEGQHPRIGAVDVVPFVPLGTTPMHDAISAASRLADRVANELSIPVFLYEMSAKNRELALLPTIRSGGLARVTRLMRAGDRVADAGPDTPHPTAGVTVIGARRALIAFNVQLRSGDLSAARRIASHVRESSGGLPAVRALGIKLGDQVQVSMNLVDFAVTSPLDALRAVEREARHLGIEVEGSELVGLIPAAALPPDPSVLRIAGFNESKVLEQRIAELGRA